MNSYLNVQTPPREADLTVSETFHYQRRYVSHRYIITKLLTLWHYETLREPRLKIEDYRRIR